MEREYPGSDRAKDRIQDEIKGATGSKAMPMSCTCGRMPMVVSVAYGLLRVACPCGFQGINKPTVDEAVADWNYQTQSRMIEALR